MKPVFIIKIFVDICMSALFLLLISYHLLDDAPHEWIGAAVFLLFSAHNILNYRWYKNLFKGKYTAVRLMQTETNLLLWVTMLGCIVSSLCISGHVFAFLDLDAARMGRSLHLVATVWAFILVSIHLGLHWQMFIGMSKKVFKVQGNAAVIFRWTARVIVLAISASALYIFITRKMWEEMFFLTEFKWFDYEKTLLVYLLENVCLMTMFGAVGHYSKKLISRITIKKQKKEITG